MIGSLRVKVDPFQRGICVQTGSFPLYKIGENPSLLVPMWFHICDVYFVIVCSSSLLHGTKCLGLCMNLEALDECSVRSPIGLHFSFILFNRQGLDQSLPMTYALGTDCFVFHIIRHFDYDLVLYVYATGFLSMKHIYSGVRAVWRS